MDSLVGRTLGNYEIVEGIGVGGMASVYKAYQPGLERHVALKVLPPFYAQQPGFQERFIREAKAIAMLNHPNILPVYDYGQSGDYSYLVMRYVEAGSLQQLVGAPVAVALTVKIVSQIGMALEAAHRMGIIHRDVKPANVLLDKDDWALLTDFGLARMLEESVHLTGTGIGIGTPTYMSPEQAQGGAIDHRTDVYSLGVVLFQMLTGDVPYKGDTPLSIVLKRMTEPLPIPRSLNPEIAESVEEVVLKSLAKDPADRFQSAAEMVQQLEAAVTADKGEYDGTRDAPVAVPISTVHSPSERETTIQPTLLGPTANLGDEDGSSGNLSKALAQSGETLPAPDPVSSVSSAAHGKRTGCPAWVIIVVTLFAVAFLLGSGVVAVKTLPQVIHSLQTTQAMAGATATPPLPLPLPLPVPPSDGGQAPGPPGVSPADGGQALAPPVIPPPDGGPAFGPPAMSPADNGQVYASPVVPSPDGARPFATPFSGVVTPIAGDGNRTQRLDLPPGRGAVSGFVRDQDGNALTRANLEVLDRRGERTIRIVATGADGGFDIVLPVGQYLLVFRDNMDPRNFVPQFYDNQNYIRALDAADILEVTEGEELTRVEVGLEHGFAVSGRLIGPNGEPIGGKGGSLASRNAGVVLMGPLGFETTPDGRFRVVAPPGQYVLSFEAPLVRKELFAPQLVRIDSDVELGDVIYERRLLPGS